MAFLCFGNAQEQVGLASVRPLAHEGMMTQSNVPFSHDSLVASHRSIPLGKIVRVTNLNNLEFVLLKINDRGPYIQNRILDLSQRAAANIGIKQNDVVEVRLEILDDDTLIASEDYPKSKDLAYAVTSDTASTEMPESKQTDLTDIDQESKTVDSPNKSTTGSVETTSTVAVAEMPENEIEDKTTNQKSPNAVAKQNATEGLNTEPSEPETEAIALENIGPSEDAADTTNAAESSIVEAKSSKETSISKDKTNSSAKTAVVERSIPTPPVDKDEAELNKTYSVQIGSFSEKDNAEAYAEELFKTYRIFNIKVRPEDKDNSYKVIVGRFTDLKYAKDYKIQLVNDVDVFEESSILIVDEASNIIPSNTYSKPRVEEETTVAFEDKKEESEEVVSAEPTQVEEMTEESVPGVTEEAVNTTQVEEVNTTEPTAVNEPEPEEIAELVPTQINEPETEEVKVEVQETLNTIAQTDSLPEPTSPKTENIVINDSISSVPEEPAKDVLVTNEPNTEVESRMLENSIEDRNEKTETTIEAPVSEQPAEVAAEVAEITPTGVMSEPVSAEPAEQEPLEVDEDMSETKVEKEIAETVPAATKSGNAPVNKKGLFTLQVGTFDNNDDAVAYAEELLETYKIYNLKVQNESGTDEYKVVVGRFTESQYAQTYKDQLVNTVDIFDENSILILDKSTELPKEELTEAEEKSTNEVTAEVSQPADVHSKEQSNVEIKATEEVVTTEETIEETEPVEESTEEKQVTTTEVESQEKANVEDDAEEIKEFFTIQVGTFETEDEAEAYAKELFDTHKIFNLKVRPLENSSGYKVIVGRFTKREYAQVYKDQLDEKVENTKIVPLEN